MARRKKPLTVEDHRLLGELRGVAKALGEGERARLDLVARLRAAGVCPEDIADAARHVRALGPDHSIGLAKRGGQAATLAGRRNVNVPKRPGKMPETERSFSSREPLLPREQFLADLGLRVRSARR